MDTYRGRTTMGEETMVPFSFSERELDLIQLEELHAENGYSDWFAEKIGLSGYSFSAARHSVSATANGSSGETDLLVFFERPGSKVAVLIEDKVSAAFTYRQAERYVERGEDLVRKGQADVFKTVLVAPSQYLASVPTTDPWQEQITVEEIASWFEAQPGHHFRWRFAALSGALQRLARNLSVSTEEVARFSLAFSQYLAATHAPNLRHKPGKDTNGPTILFPGSSAKKTLWWKFSSDQMILQLTHEYQGLAETLELPPGIDLEPAREHDRKSDYLIAPVPPVELSVPFESQIPLVEDALDAARRLIDVIPRLEAILSAKD